MTKKFNLKQSQEYFKKVSKIMQEANAKGLNASDKLLYLKIKLGIK
jgi:hypothetical protein